jgi:hypothetical protein
MGLFGGIKNAKFSDGGVYLLDGVYRLEVQALKMIEVRVGKRKAFVAEFKILESSNPARLKGSSVTWMVMMDLDAALGNIKNFMESLIPGLDQVSEEEFETACDESVSEANPLKGHNVRASAWTIKTKKGGDFTKVKYMPDVTSLADMQKEHEAGK